MSFSPPLVRVGAPRPSGRDFLPGLPGDPFVRAAKTLTLIHANRPAMETRLGNSVPVRAAGRLLADTALWTWFALRHEPNRRLRAATFAA